MSLYFIIVLAALIAMTGFAAILWLSLDTQREYSLFLLNQKKPFERKKRLMSPNELKLFNILKSFETLNKYDIFPQVPYSALMDVNSDTTDLGMRFDVINSYRSDFVIVNKDSSSVVLVIELNDQSHWYNYKKARDNFVYSALKSVAIPLLVLETKNLVKPENIEVEIKSKLSQLKPNGSTTSN